MNLPTLPLENLPLPKSNQCYIASLPEFGLYAHTHGDTYEEALASREFFVRGSNPMSTRLVFLAVILLSQHASPKPVSYTHLTLPTNREV